MTGAEDLLRTATSEAAAQVTPESIPPLDVAALSTALSTALPTGRVGRVPGPGARRTWLPGFAVPLAAALAVVAVAALSVALPRVLTGHGTLSQSASQSAGPVAVPPYYVALTGTVAPWDDHPLDITVRSTLTGRALATVRPPAPYGTFSIVATGTGDDTFLVGAQPWEPLANGDNDDAPVTFLLLRFDPSTRAATVSSLPVPAVPGDELESVSLSPDGSTLAEAVGSATTLRELTVYSLAAGGERTWSFSGPRYSDVRVIGGVIPNALQWRPDGHTLAFNLFMPGTAANTGTYGIRELDADGPGGDLLADSRAVFTQDTPTTTFSCDDALLLSADGTTVTCAGTLVSSLGDSTHINGFGVYSVATGILTSERDLTAVAAPVVVDPASSPSSLLVYPRLLWQDGDIIIGTVAGPFVVLDNGQLHSTPLNSRVTSAQGFGLTAAW